jgi:alpha-beta hydrolase superfamily lysophospholipase
MNWKNAHPGGRVWLLGHSAGCHVALHAAGAMPPDTIEKMALLVPSCSTKADIAGALRASRLGVHVWYSEADWLILGIVMKVSGCGDDYSTSKAAGRFGFQPIPKSPDEIDLMRRRLRQYPWHQVHSTLGHNGGHYGVYRSQFSQVIVLPILFSPVVD